MRRLILLIFPALLLTTMALSAQPLEVQSVCRLATPDKVRLFDWSSWRTTYIRDQNIYFEPFRWDASRNIWQGYDSDRPFDQPRDAYKHWSVTLIQADGTEQWIYILDSRSTPDTDYVYVFDDVQPAQSHSGGHFGFHPCLAFATADTVIDDWLNRVRNAS